MMLGYTRAPREQLTPTVYAVCAAIGVAFGLLLATGLWVEARRHVPPHAAPSMDHKPPAIPRSIR